MRKTLILTLLVLAIAAFRPLPKTYYRYTLIMQAMVNDQSQIMSEYEYISYNGYLIEFINKEFSEEHRYADPDRSTYIEWTQPLKVHFIDISAKTYFSIDTFSLDSKLIAQGPLKEKNLGMNIADSVTADEAQDYNIANCKDTIFNGIEYMYYPYSIKDKQGQDSIYCKVLFLKDPTLNSILSIDRKSYLQNKYPLAGLIAFTKDFKQGFAMYIKDKKAISKDEALTIERILEKYSNKN